MENNENYAVEWMKIAFNLTWTWAMQSINFNKKFQTGTLNECDALSG